MKKAVRHIYLGILFIVVLFIAAYGAIQYDSKVAFSSAHPKLILTSQGVVKIKKQLSTIPLFDESFSKAIKEVDLFIDEGINVPIPKDPAGGFTHEQHKRNYRFMQKAGALFQLTDNDKYAVFVRDMLLKYADMFPNLSLHPVEKSYARGKLFWQCLNDANWLVYTSQAYDCIYDWLHENERAKLEKDLFRPYADFLSVETPHFFNRIHNHSTWANAAVGMIGLVMNDEELVERALYGLKNDKIDESRIDNDGGAIKLKNQESAGFLAQLDQLFSPDGYYTEGPYYQRYAMYPFIIFAASLQNTKPDLKIFEYRNEILEKALFALINLSDANGNFFPLNDAQKGMSVYAPELISAVNIIYYYGGENNALLSLAEKQGSVLLNDAGLSVALGIKEDKSKQLFKSSVNLSDGIKGNKGGIGVLRIPNSQDQFELAFKYSSQGMGHGHFDKLSFSFYNNGNEVIQDYGMARFVNINHKRGGRYLPENKSFAKQTVAHNTLVVNGLSNYNGKVRIGNLHHPELYFFDAKDERIQIVSAQDSTAYEGVKMQRAMALISENEFEKSFIIDVLQVKSDQSNQYDLPFYYKGKFMGANFKYEAENTLSPLGKENGYQHLWKAAHGKPENNNVKITWLLDNEFYTITSLVAEKDELFFGSIGANDPEFNLRRDPYYMIRKTKTGDCTFLSIIEPHGSYSPVNELPVNAYSSIKNLRLVNSNSAYSVIEFEHKNSEKWQLILANNNADSSYWHELKIENISRTWRGPYHYYKM